MSMFMATDHQVSFMADSQRDNVIWQIAVQWIIREHESPLDAAAENELAVWLNEDPANHAAYAEASRVWLLTGSGSAL